MRSGQLRRASAMVVGGSAAKIVSTLLMICSSLVFYVHANIIVKRIAATSLHPDRWVCWSHERPLEAPGGDRRQTLPADS